MKKGEKLLKSTVATAEQVATVEVPWQVLKLRTDKQPVICDVSHSECKVTIGTGASQKVTSFSRKSPAYPGAFPIWCGEAPYGFESPIFHMAIEAVIARVFCLKLDCEDAKADVDIRKFPYGTASTIRDVEYRPQPDGTIEIRVAISGVEHTGVCKSDRIGKDTYHTVTGIVSAFTGRNSAIGAWLGGLK